MQQLYLGTILLLVILAACCKQPDEATQNQTALKDVIPGWLVKDTGNVHSANSLPAECTETKQDALPKCWGDYNDKQSRKEQRNQRTEQQIKDAVNGIPVIHETPGEGITVTFQ